MIRLQINRQGGAATYFYKRFNKLDAGQSLILDFDLNSDLINNPGNYVILLEANPLNDQIRAIPF
ncbi:MAG: hypothetical protein R2728_12805 [Chitinophagales bacterium]